MRRLALIALSFALLSAVLSGCTPASSPQPATEPPTKRASIEPMSFEQKQADIATTFPVEVPVPLGDVSRGEAQGDDAWDYELVVAAPIAEVESWYRQAYTGRTWQLTERTGSGSVVSLTFMKASAQSRVDLSEKDGRTTAAVILGVGAPVLQTQ